MENSRLISCKLPLTEEWASGAFILGVFNDPPTWKLIMKLHTQEKKASTVSKAPQ